MADFTYDDEERLQIEPFRPDVAVAYFDIVHKEIDIKSIKIFFLNAGKLKKSLRMCPKLEVTAKFGDWSVTFKNTHNPALGKVQLAENDLTLHRISGYLAKRLIRWINYGAADKKELVKKEIINPLAEAAGITWNNSNPEFYLSFFPGTEFFLADFQGYPLAITAVRVKKGMLKSDFLQKVLRQKYNGKDPVVWMKDELATIQKAVAEVGKHPLIKMSLLPHINEFLANLGIPTVGSLI
ncbi:N [Okola virus]|uniref:Nucleoprotein n=1 Tax=Okola virus TaxID=2748254 RepID=A0A7D9MVW3_9VIRU|nr:N [Okola virus] [Okola virus]QLA47049.1 N [Okola virus] [Okola virus]